MELQPAAGCDEQRGLDLQLAEIGVADGCEVRTHGDASSGGRAAMADGDASGDAQ